MVRRRDGPLRPSRHHHAIPAIRILHLVWAPLGAEMLRGFLAALREHPPGDGAALSVILNGFAARSEAGEHLEALDGVDADVVWTEGPLQDLGAYAVAARAAREPLVCLMNSYARPLRDGWLGALGEARGSGAAGATGSWESHASELGFAARRRAGSGLRDAAGAAVDWAAYRARFPRFPNPHLRSNGLLCSRELLVDVVRRPPRGKAEAYVLESGRRGLSRRAGDLMVVGADGRAHGPDDWPASRTWRSGEQENLLIADNRTREWDAAGPAEREAMRRRSWGRDV